jgi:hypothetical protein
VNTATWQRVLDLLVDEHYARALAAGTLIRHPQAFRTSARARYEQQAADHPGFAQAQADRLLGEVNRPGTTAICPTCGITFDPRPIPAAYRHAAPTPSPPLHPRMTNDRYVVAVPDEHRDAYVRLGYRDLDHAVADATLPDLDDQPTRGSTGLLYCRASCASLAPIDADDTRL